MTQPSTALDSHATLTFGDRSVDLPLITGTEGEVAVDIGKLRKETGLITLDPGFVNTGSCRSAITFVDGERGILRYRGYPIEQLANGSSFLEVAWLLIYGERPSAAEGALFEEEIRSHATLPEGLSQLLSAMPATGHPMTILASAVSALAAFEPDPQDEEQSRKAMLRLIARLPVLAAQSYKHTLGEPSVDTSSELTYAENFLNMMFGTPGQASSVDPAVVKALDLLLILHADHEQNCSTSAVRLVASSKAHPYAAIAAGISALWGPLHGGANQAVIEMLEEIAAGGGSARDFLERAKSKQDTTRLMGFGHRVYKSYDPRARILKGACDEVLAGLGQGSKLLDIARELEQITLEDDYFVSRSLYPNVDFYSGVIYKALGIPTDMFTVMFAIGRLPGWLAQWRELRASSEFRIGRPRQLYVGATERSV